MGILMEYAERGTLRKVLDEDAGMGAEQRQQMAVGVLRGVSHLHTAQNKPLLHGDLKSANALVMKDGTCKIADFGIATRFGMELTLDVGTARFMAPEVRLRGWKKCWGEDMGGSGDEVVWT